MTRTTSRTRGAAAALTLVAGLGLTACGEEGPDSAEEPSTSESPSTPTEEPSETPTEEPAEELAGPACADVWVAGATLPERYDGCQDADKGKWVQAMVYHCSSGQRLVTYGTTFYAAKGEVVNESKVPLRRNREFHKVLASCGA
ncbi:hypothetical protein [Nocardioides sp.]|uniref:hypothetical protein n=1 Tax=Nocardioides sp. TaxID=35761 RepID=UPI0026140FEE|nr:hypothetical protein [Nocardioides sp.]MCW2735472.1 hypothetical protein [Nocardioides sp.]